MHEKASDNAQQPQPSDGNQAIDVYVNETRCKRLLHKIQLECDANRADIISADNKAFAKVIITYELYKYKMKDSKYKNRNRKRDQYILVKLIAQQILKDIFPIGSKNDRGHQVIPLQRKLSQVYKMYMLLKDMFNDYDLPPISYKGSNHVYFAMLLCMLNTTKWSKDDIENVKFKSFFQIHYVTKQEYCDNEISVQSLLDSDLNKSDGRTYYKNNNWIFSHFAKLIDQEC